MPTVMELDVKPVQTYMGSVSAVLALPEGEVILSHNEYYRNNKQHVVRLDHTGKTSCKLYISDKVIAGLTLQDDQVVILHRDGTLTWIQIKDGSKMDQYKVNVKCLAGGIALDNDTLLLVDHGDSHYRRSDGRVFTFSKSSRKTTDMVNNLNRPTSVDKTLINNEVVYVVSENESVGIYNHDWTLQRSVTREGHKRFNPYSAIVLSNNTMLVSDYEKHCISEFTLDGQFLAEKDKMEYPSNISLYHPYVWIRHGIRPSNVRCYKINN